MEVRGSVLYSAPSLLHGSIILHWFFFDVWYYIRYNRAECKKKKKKKTATPAAENDKLMGEAKCKYEKQGTTTLKHI